MDICGAGGGLSIMPAPQVSVCSKPLKRRDKNGFHYIELLSLLVSVAAILGAIWLLEK